MSGPFTSPVALSVPFLSEPERSNGFTSKNVQEAIEEALALAISNDVFLVLPQYNGNANVGRHLEFFYGINSDDAPLFFTSTSKVIAIVGSTTAANATCKIGFFDKQVSITIPLYELEFTADKRVTVIGTPLVPIFSIASGAELLIKITEGSINSPHLQVVFSSSLDGGS